MPTSTYVELDKITVATAATSVTFSSISQEYTDLVLVMQTRCTGGQNSSGIDIYGYINGVSTSVYSNTQMYGNGSSAASNRGSNWSYLYAGISSNNGANDWPNTTLHLMNYSNSTKNKIVLSRADSPLSYTTAKANLWRSTAAITSITLFLELNLSFAVGSTFSLYGIKKQSTPGTAKATGGTITYDNFGYVYHTFTSTGTFEPLVTLSCDYAVVAGGGGGGTRWAGGGGAGGMRSTFGATGGSGSLESPISLSPNNYTITVGGSGAGATGVYVAGTQGTNSVFSTITSTGGGGGGSGSSAYSTTGGSGGGGGMRLGTSPAGWGAAGTSGQGYGGGNAAASGGYAGGGGGGAGSAGSDADTSNFSNAGNGGAGRTIYVGGTAVSLAGGGGGGSEGGGTFYGDGGLGGGGNGNSSAGQGANGSANTGGGGGGGGNDSGTGGAGGSGIVIIRYSGI